MGKVTGFNGIKAKSPELNRIQANIDTFADSVTSIPILDGNLIKDVELSSSETQVSHKLGRKYRGWIIVDKNAQQDVWVSSTDLTQRFLALTAAGSVTVSLWVF